MPYYCVLHTPKDRDKERNPVSKPRKMGGGDLFQKLCTANSEDYTVFHRETTEGDDRTQFITSSPNFLKTTATGRREREKIASFLGAEENRNNFTLSPCK